MNKQVINQDQVRQILFIIILVALGILLFLELFSFLPALLGAITLYILMRRWMIYLCYVKKMKKALAATLLMLLSMVVILFPIFILINMMSSKVAYAIEHGNELIVALKKVIGDIEQRFNMDLVSNENINNLGKRITNGIPQLLNATFNTLTTIFFMYFMLYFMLVNGKKMEIAIYEHTPLHDDNVHRLGKEVNNMVVSNAIGIPLIALLQGVVAVIGYLIIGVKEPWFWFVVTCITAMLPVVGAALAYVPIAIIFFANGDTTQGVAMLIFGFGIIGLVDNVFRFTLASKIGNVHPLITVFGVIVGLKVFGFIGLIFGPLLISLFILLLRIYSNEFIHKQRDLTKIMEN
jgi:predicted PurR-regulated permease PerM